MLGTKVYCIIPFTSGVRPAKWIYGFGGLDSGNPGWGLEQGTKQRFGGSVLFYLVILILVT